MRDRSDRTAGHPLAVSPTSEPSEADHFDERTATLTSFLDLGVRAELADTLAGQGITTPFPIQTLTIPDALAGRDICGKAKTGSGKTLAFGLPLLDRLLPSGRPSKPAALILVPTRELAAQVAAELVPLAAAVDLAVLTLYGGTDVDRDVARLRAGVDVAVATPGRLIDLLDRKAISLEHVQALVIDEADRMADMGFLPQVEWVMRHLSGSGRQTLLFSATLDSAVDSLVRRHLHDPVHHEVVSDTATVDEMTHRFLAVHKMDRVKVAAAIARNTGRTIVFTRTKRGADRLVEQAAAEGVAVKAIHGDLSQPARERALKAFEQGKVEMLVATDVAARGIHVDDIDVVIHYDPPEDHKTYLHRSGRTARAGRTGVVATFVLWDQVREVDQLKKRLGLSDDNVEVFSNDPRLTDLAAFDAPPRPRRTALAS